MREIKLRMQLLQAARRLSRTAHEERCHWLEGCNNNVGVTAGKTSHNHGCHCGQDGTQL